MLLIWGMSNGALEAQDSIPLAVRGVFELNMPVHWRVQAYFASPNGDLYLAGKDNDFEDFASLFVAKVDTLGNFIKLFSADLPEPGPKNSDYFLHQIRISQNGRIELAGVVSKHGKTDADSLVKYAFDLKGKRLERISAINPHPGKVANIRFDGADFIICGSVPDPANQTQRPYLSVYDAQLKEKTSRTFDPFWEINDAVRVQNGTIYACGYLPRHGVVFINLPPNGDPIYPKAGFVEGNSIQILEGGENITLLVQSLTTVVQKITPAGITKWRTELDGATLSILGNWAFRPGTRLKDGSFVIASAHREGRQEFIQLSKISPEGKVTLTENFGPFEEAKACYIHTTPDGGIRIMAYCRDAWDWNLHLIQTDTNGKIK